MPVAWSVSHFPMYRRRGVLIFAGSPRSTRHKNTVSDTAELTQAGHKRLRISVACETCREKKLKCDALKPACSICIRKKLTCQYAAIGRRRRDPTVPILSSPSSEQTASQGSGLVSRGLAGPSQGQDWAASEPANAERDRTEEGQQRTASTVASRSDAGSTTPGQTDEARPLTPDPGWRSGLESQPLRTPVGPDLLPYIDSLLENVHPISCNNFLHPGSVCEALHRAPHLLVLSVCGSSAKFMSGSNNKSDGHRWAEEAKNLISKSLDRVSTLTTSAIQFLVLHEMHEAEYTSAWNLVGEFAFMISIMSLTAQVSRLGCHFS